jgi:signal transduction histidine kinase
MQARSTIAMRKGMGLYMVKSLEYLGRTINISSKLNNGITFTLRLKN